MKICVIKLGADGDVLRTLPVIEAIKKNHENSEIMVITKGEIKTLIENQEFIDNVLSVPYFGPDEFDYLYNFDIDKTALELAEKIKASRKYGFFDESGYPAPYNLGAEYYLNTLFDDEVKKENKKTYQEMMSMVAEIPYEKKKYTLKIESKDREYAEEFKKINNLENKRIIGIHIGAGKRWPSKAWHSEEIKKFVKSVKNRGYEIILFAGLIESEKQEKIISDLSKVGIKTYTNNPSNSMGEIVSLMNLCDLIVCADSFALHVSIGLGKKTIGLFFCTSPDEVESYGLLTKIVSPKLEEYFPERMNEYNEELTKSISAEEVFEKVEEIL